MNAGMKCKSSVLLLGLLTILPVHGAPSSTDRGMVVLYLVRHAETVPPPYRENPPNPPLSGAGQAREFDRLYILILDDAGNVTTMHLRYGGS